MAQQTIQIADKPTLDSIYSLLSQGTSVIKSIQRGVVTMGAAASITVTLSNVVDVNKAMVNFLGCSSTDGSCYGRYILFRMQLVNNSTIQIDRSSPQNDNTIVNYEVIEFY